VRLDRVLLALGGALALACDAVPDLYVADASIDATTGAVDGGTDDGPGAIDAGLDAGVDAGSDAGPEAEPDACGPVSCPSCAPPGGQCCAGDIPCFGNNCTKDCAACSGCPAGDICCSKPGNAKPGCRAADAGACP
jgi:hypothetical protein